MGDRAWAQITLYQIGGRQEVEAICEFIDEHLGGYPNGCTTELQVWGDYSEGEVSLGLVDEAETLAEQTPTSIWSLHQAGYDGPGETAYFLPGLGVFRCYDDGGPLFTLLEVQEILAAKGQERDRLMGKPWLDVTAGLAAWLNAVPEDQRPKFIRPTPDEVEEFTLVAGPTCKECHEPIGSDSDYGMCAECFHDALRSGWTPGGKQ